MDPRKEPTFSYRLLRAVYPAFRMVFPDLVIRSDDLARAMEPLEIANAVRRISLVWRKGFPRIAAIDALADTILTTLPNTVRPIGRVAHAGTASAGKRTPRRRKL